MNFNKINFCYSSILPLFLILLGTCSSYAQNYKKDNDIIKNNLPIYFPLSSKDMTRVSSPYGYRIHPILKKLKKHNGIDLAAKEGKPVYATAAGIVEKVDFDRGYGNRILIKHKESIKTLYAHLKHQSVKKGQKIKRGDIIGSVGKTGIATGPHLHYEIWIYDVKIDPMIVWTQTLKNNQTKVNIKK